MQALARELSLANAALRDHNAQNTSALTQFEELLSEYRGHATSSESDVIDGLRKKVADLELELSQKNTGAAQRDLEQASLVRELEASAQELTRTKEELRKCRKVTEKYEEEIKQAINEAIQLSTENERLVRVVQELEIAQHETKGRLLQKDAEVKKLLVFFFFFVLFFFLFFPSPIIG
jgi:hypothetical protein